MILSAFLLVLCVQIPRGTVVVEPGTLSTTGVYGLEGTHSSSQLINSIIGDHVSLALRVQIGEVSSENNATQLGLQTSAPVKAGDTMLATFLVRGTSAKGAAHIR